MQAAAVTLKQGFNAGNLLGVSRAILCWCADMGMLCVQQMVCLQILWHRDLSGFSAHNLRWTKCKRACKAPLSVTWCCSPCWGCCPAAIDPGMKGPQQDEHRASPWQALSSRAPELAAGCFPCTVLPRQPPRPVCISPGYFPASRTRVYHFLNSMQHTGSCLMKGRIAGSWR